MKYIRVEAILLLLLVGAGMIGTVSAAKFNLVPIVDGSVRDGLDAPKDGIPDYVLENSVVQVLNVEQFEDRGIIEFDLSTLPRSITNAQLSLTVFGSNGPYPFEVEVLTYKGDGILSLSDFNAGTSFYVFNYAGEEAINFDVTSFVQNTVNSGSRYAGFNIRTVPSIIPMNGPYVAFNSIEYPPAAKLIIKTKGK